MSTSTCRRLLEWLGLLALLAFASGCGGSSSGGSVLTLVSFVGAGTDGVIYRNQPLEFVFSAKIDPDSVSIIALQLRSNDQIVPGRIEVDGERILWSPVVLPGERNDYNPPNYPPINGLGFEGATKYTVQMLGGSPFSMKSEKGRPLANSYQASFTTSTDFLPETNPVPPTVLKDQIEFNPPPLNDDGNLDPFSNDDSLWPLLDPSQVTILVPFSERMRPDPIDPFHTFTVTNITVVPDPAPPGVGEIALVDVELVPEADAMLATALVTLGDWPGSEDPYIFEVRLTTDLTDLDGNPLPADVVFHFKTADKFGELNYEVITEDFLTTTFRDSTNTNAKWIAGSGVLEGKDVGRRTTEFVPTPTSPFLLAHPLVDAANTFTPLGCRFQMRFGNSAVNANPGESIIGMSWAPKSSFLFYGSYRNVKMKLGHFAGPNGTDLDFFYDRNYDQGVPNNPLTVFSGDYSLPASTSTDWAAWPEFAKDFEYDTSKDLILEWDMPEGGDTFQLFKNKSTASTPRNRLYSNGGADRASNGRENTQYNHRFTLVSKRSFGQSKGYGPSGTFGSTVYGAFLVVADLGRSGTAYSVTWAEASAGSDVVPGATFYDDISRLNGASAAAFRAELTANAFTGVVPRIFSISFAVADADAAE